MDAGAYQWETQRQTGEEWDRQAWRWRKGQWLWLRQQHSHLQTKYRKHVTTTGASHMLYISATTFPPPPALPPTYLAEAGSVRAGRPGRARAPAARAGPAAACWAGAAAAGAAASAGAAAGRRAAGRPAAAAAAAAVAIQRERREEEEEEERSKRGAERGGKITEELTTVCEREETEDGGLFVLCECGVSALARLCRDLSYTSLPLLLPLRTLSLSVCVHLVFPPVFWAVPQCCVPLFVCVHVCEFAKTDTKLNWYTSSQACQCMWLVIVYDTKPLV